MISSGPLFLALGLGLCFPLAAPGLLFHVGVLVQSKARVSSPRWPILLQA